jgi:hypothetical protein
MNKKNIFVFNYLLLLIFLLNGVIVKAQNPNSRKNSLVQTQRIVTAASITPTSASVCSGSPINVTFTVSGAAPGATFQWIKRPGATAIVAATGNTYTTGTAGTYACIINPGLSSVDTLNNVVLTINALPTVTVTSTATNNTICNGQSTTLTASGASSYSWSPATGLNTTSGATVTASPTSTTTYTVVGTASNGCTNNASIQINVNPLPSVPTITPSATTVCSGTTVTLSTPAASGQTYAWSFNPTGPGANTGASINHVFTAANAGAGTENITATLVTTITATGCKRSDDQVIVVKQAPDASLNDFTSPVPFSICAGSINYLEVTNISTTSSINTNYQINWGDGGADFVSNPAGFPVNTGVANHNYITTGYYTLTNTVTGNNGCQTSKTYSIYKGSNPEVPFTNSGSTTGLCAPYTFSLPSQATSNPPGTVYIVTINDGSPVETFTTLPAVYTHTFNTNSCGATGAITSNSYKITIRAQNPCGSSDLTIEPITLNSKPKAICSISSDTLVSNNQLITFTNSSINGVNVSVTGVCTYVSPNNWTISPTTGYTIASGSLGNVTPTNNPATWGSQNLGVVFNTLGIYEITNFVRNTCGADTIKKRIYVIPTITSSSSTNPTNCATATGTIILNGLNTSTPYTVHYTNAAGAQTVTLTSNASGVITIPTLPAGTYSNVYVTLNNCSSNTVGPFSLSDPNSPETPVIAGVNPICSGSTLNIFVASPVTGVTYTWIGPNGYFSIGPIQSIIINSVSTNASGSYYVTATKNNCTSPAGSVNVVVDSTPAKPTITSNTPVCTGAPLTLGATTTSTMPVTWSWTGPNSYTNPTQNPQVSPTATTAMSGIYNVTATASYTSPTLTCTSATATTTVVVNSTPVITSISSTNPTSCASATGTIVLNGLAASTSYTVHYTISSVPQTRTISSNSSGLITIPSLPGGSYSNVYVTLNNCSSNTVGPFTLSEPTPPTPTVSGPVIYYQNTTALPLSNSVTALSNYTINYYTSPTILTGTTIAPTPSTSTVGTFIYYVSQNNSTCESPRAAIMVYVLQSTTPQNIGINIDNPQRNLHVKDVMRLEPRLNAPPNSAQGDIYFDSNLKKLRVYDGTNWMDCW